jgi:hypothetical protein
MAKQGYANLMAEYEAEVVNKSPSKRRNGTTSGNYKRSNYDPSVPSKRGNRRASAVPKGGLNELDDL